MRCSGRQFLNRIFESNFWFEFLIRIFECLSRTLSYLLFIKGYRKRGKAMKSRAKDQSVKYCFQNGHKRERGCFQPVTVWWEEKGDESLVYSSLFCTLYLKIYLQRHFLTLDERIRTSIRLWQEPTPCHSTRQSVSYSVRSINPSSLNNRKLLKRYLSILQVTKWSILIAM